MLGASTFVDAQTVELSEPPFVVNTTTAGDQSSPSVSCLSDGRCVVAWVSAQTGAQGVFARVFAGSSTQAGSQFTIAATSSVPERADICRSDASGFTALWSVDDTLFARTFDWSGSPLASAMELDVDLSSRIDCFADGRFLATRTLEETDGGGETTRLAVVALLVGADGSPEGAEFFLDDKPAEFQVLLDSDLGPNGRATVAWGVIHPLAVGVPGPVVLSEVRSRFVSPAGLLGAQVAQVASVPTTSNPVHFIWSFRVAADARGFASLTRTSESFTDGFDPGNSYENRSLAGARHDVLLSPTSPASPLFESSHEDAGSDGNDIASSGDATLGVWTQEASLSGLPHGNTIEAASWTAHGTGTAQINAAIDGATRRAVTTAAAIERYLVAWQVDSNVDGDGEGIVARFVCIDSDGDGKCGADDECPGEDRNDADRDDLCSFEDNCPDERNADQSDADGDGVGDACDQCPGIDDTLDPDCDGLDSIADNCPLDANPGQADSDSDGNGDICDLCEGFEDALDADADGTPNDCDICDNSSGAATLAAKTRLKLKGVATGAAPGKGSMVFSGEADRDLYNTGDPEADGARIVVQDRNNAIVLDLVLPAGSYAGAGTAGWRTKSGGGPKRIFLDKTGTSTTGIAKMLIKRTGSAMKLKIIGRKGDYALPGDALPLRLTIEVGDVVGDAGYCLESGFNEGVCRSDTGGDSLNCRL